MQIMIQHLGVRSTDALDRAIESRLLALQAVRHIEQANVSVARRWDAAPPFLVRVHLVTPGPDVRVEGADHTARAAALKALQALESALRQRAVRQLQRVKTNLQQPAVGRQGLRRVASR